MHYNISLEWGNGKSNISKEYLRDVLLGPEKIASRSLMNNTLVYIDIDYQGIHYFIRGENKVE